jgi:hypothetical protein
VHVITAVSLLERIELKRPPESSTPAAAERLKQIGQGLRKELEAVTAQLNERKGLMGQLQLQQQVFSHRPRPP